MTGFKGIRNQNGRPKGTSNKITNEVRDSFKNLIDNNMEQIQNDIEKLKPYERIKILLELAKFVIPTLKAIDYVGETKNKERPKIVFITKT